MRSLWNGALTFGLVTIPVKLYAATERKDPRFHYLHEACHTPIQYQKFCPTCGREVGPDEIVWGYEYQRGQYVVFTEGELELAGAAGQRRVEISDFVNLEEIDPIYFDRTYFLEPEEGGRKAYALFRQAIDRSGRLALGTVTIRSRETLCAVRPYGSDLLALSTMYYPDEIRSAEGLRQPAEDGVIAPEELAMALQLIELRAGPFRPEAYRNRRRETLLEMIEQKQRQEEIVAPPTAPEGGRVADLMEALRRSLADSEGPEAHS